MKINGAFLLACFGWVALALLSPAESLVSASSQKTIGEFEPKSQLLKLNCQEKEFKSITFSTTTNSKSNGFCPPQIKMKKVAFNYKSGLSQQFEFPSDDGTDGIHLTTATLNVLPGTKCLSGIAFSAVRSKSVAAQCGELAKIKISLNF